MKSSMIKSRRVRAEHVALMREIRSLYRILRSRPERKRVLEIYRYSWEDNIKVDLKEIR
jgi:hypothetical protein